MIIIIDDLPETAEIWIKPLETVTGIETLHRLPDDGYLFICEQPWRIDLVLIDEVFETVMSELFDGGTSLGEAIYKQFDFIPMVLYTANDTSFERAREAMARGFCYALNKNEIFRQDTIEIPGVGIRAITELEYLSNLINKIKSSIPYQRVIERRKKVRLEYIDQVLTSLSDHDLGELHKEIYQYESSVKNFKIKHNNEQLILADLLNGWIDPQQYTENEFRQLIINESLLPSHFKFGNPTWQHQYKLYQQEDNPYRYRTIERRAINFLLEALEIDKQYNSEKIYTLSPENAINYASFTFNKKVDHSLIFDDKMVARRILIASALPGLFKKLGIKELVALIIRGRTDTRILQPKKQPKLQGNEYIDPATFTSTQLELKSQKEKIVNDRMKMTKQEVKWLQFVTDGSFEELKKIIEAYARSYKKNLDGLKLHLIDCKNSEESFAEVVLNLQNECQSYCSKALPIINPIIESIR